MVSPYFARESDWRYQHVIRTTVSIAAGGSLTVYDETAFNGWMLHVIAAFSVATMTVRYRVTGPMGQLMPTYSPYLLNLYGFTDPTPAGVLPWVVQYSAGPPPVYSMAFSPVFPGLPFHGTLQVVLANPSVSAGTVYLFEMSLVRVQQ